MTCNDNGTKRESTKNEINTSTVVLKDRTRRLSEIEGRNGRSEAERMGSEKEILNCALFSACKFDALSDTFSISKIVLSETIGSSNFGNKAAHSIDQKCQPDPYIPNTGSQRCPYSCSCL